MRTIHHRYVWPLRLFTQIFNLFGLTYPIILLVLFLFDTVETNKQVTLHSLLLMIVFALITWLFFGPIIILSGNYFMDIASDTEGLRIVFLWKKILIPWNEIIALKPHYYLFFWKIGLSGLARYQHFFDCMVYCILFAFTPALFMIR